MSISFRKYVDITSGVGGAAQVNQRELIGRLISINKLIPTGSVLEFSSLESVGLYFGTASEEYSRAQFYFGWVSKLITTPKKISFARWADVATAPQIFGVEANQTLASWTAISDGAFDLTLGVDTETVSGLDFSSDLSLTDVAATIEAGIQAANVATQWTSAVVTYNAINKRFELTGGETGPAVVVVANAGAGTEIATMAGWLSSGTILSDGVAIESITEMLSSSTAKTNNFGSFEFMPVIDLAEATEAATWNAAQNVLFQFYYTVTEANAQTTFDALKDFGGTGVIINTGIAGEYPAMMPMNVLAATDYTRRNSNQNYMFQRFNITATVTDTATSDSLDAIRMNYYGETQQAGGLIEFFQRGLLMGLATDPLDMNTYANEQWLKDAAGVAVMNLLLALSAVPANDSGRAQVLSILQPVIEQGTFNGVISVGKALNPTQQAFVSSITGDENAWRQIETIGYWIDAVITEPSAGEFQVTYQLVYAKADTIRKIVGSHTLI